MRLSLRFFVPALISFFAVTLKSEAALVLRYTFDDQANPTADSGTGTAAPGTLIGAGSSFVTNTPSGTGAAYYTNGTNSYITTGTTALPDTGTDPAKLNTLQSFTLTLWVNMRATPTADNLRFISDWTGDAGFDLRFGNYSATSFRPVLQVDNVVKGPAGSTSAGSISNYLNEWVFLAVTYNGAVTTSNVVFYNGTVSGAAAQLGGVESFATGTVNTNTVHFQVGGTPATDANRSPNAYFDDIRVYDTVLDAAAIEAIRVEGIPEPGSLMLISLAGAATLVRRRRK